jgi:AcrR family transcriptional regulator
MKVAAAASTPARTRANKAIAATEAPGATPRPAPLREPLSTERIEVAALALIEQVGMEAFSTRKLGQALGCEAMSIYHHYPSKAHILDALVDRVIASMPSPASSLVPAERLHELAHAWRRMARTYPNFYAWLSMHRWNSETGVRYMAQILACFHDAGLTPERAARGFRVLAYYMLGATLDETSGYARGASSLKPLTQEALERDYPLVAQAATFFTPQHFDKTFELGLQALLQELGLQNKPPAREKAPTRRPVKPVP